MKHLSLIVFALISASNAFAVPAVENSLVDFAKRGGSNNVVRVVALFEMEQASRYPNRYDSRGVVQFLKLRAERAFDRLEKHLATVENGNQVRVDDFRWINNAVVATVTPAGLKALAQAPNVERIYANGRIVYMNPAGWSPVSNGFLDSTLAGSEWPFNLKDLGIDRLNEKQPTIDGTGVIVGSMDTGVDGNHPGLKGKVIAFYDAKKDKITAPYDLDSHGTHTVGTMIGGDRANAKFGVAPGARIVSTAALQGFDTMLKGMEWLLDPDKDANTADFPRVINNSWRSDGAPDQELFYRAISAWEAAGIFVVFSAGNSGPNDKTITHPHEHPYVVAVAATDENGKVTDFSSRGPAIFQGKTVQKPDISAPGKDVISSVPGGKMEAMSGTSMAAPHVAGVAALLLQVNPKLTPAEIREVLIKSSMPVDVDGNAISTHTWTKTYGMGRLNAYEAVRMLAKFSDSFASINETIMNAFDLSDDLHSANASATLKTEDFGRGVDPKNNRWVKAWDIWANF